jgi:hypothetical protein
VQKAKPNRTETESFIQDKIPPSLSHGESRMATHLSGGRNRTRDSRRAEEDAGVGCTGSQATEREDTKSSRAKAGKSFLERTLQRMGSGFVYLNVRESIA